MQHIIRWKHAWNDVDAWQGDWRLEGKVLVWSVVSMLLGPAVSNKTSSVIQVMTVLCTINSMAATNMVPANPMVEIKSLTKETLRKQQSHSQIQNTQAHERTPGHTSWEIPSGVRRMLSNSPPGTPPGAFQLGPAYWRPKMASNNQGAVGYKRSIVHLRMIPKSLPWAVWKRDSSPTSEVRSQCRRKPPCKVDWAAPNSLSACRSDNPGAPPPSPHQITRLTGLGPEHGKSPKEGWLHRP